MSETNSEKLQRIKTETETLWKVSPNFKWLIERLEKYEEALEEIAYHVATPIGEEEDYKKTVYEFIDIAKRGLGY